MTQHRPVRWGIFGFGWVAQDYMAPAIAAAGDILVAVADPDPRSRQRAEGLGVRAYPDEAALLADPEIEAIYVATPNHLHADAVVRIAAAGKAVLCEKPMAASLADAERMLAACRGVGILYGTAFDQRHHPAHRAMRDGIRSGRIGRPTVIRIVYACWVGCEWSDPDGRENWRVDPAKAGGGALIDLAPHGIDLAEYLLGEPLARVAAMTQRRVQDYPVDDGAVIVGTTASGILANLHVAYNCPEALPRRRLEVVGSTAMLSAENTMGQTGGGSVTLIDGLTGAREAMHVPDAEVSPFTGQVLAFSAALRSGEWRAFSGERDLGTMRLIAQAYASAGA
ncbi:Gfo/Idh/MocA family protein [uncultured Enterovirga sp.]|uniref:Gfo/Idh/MocA family protein n=1 Tax=uncultured Enterovirga sp. TaxID=2026352 RepID=UPI0035CC2076